MPPDFTLSLHALDMRPSLGFITRQGPHLMDGNREFRFVSVNVPNLLNVEDKPDERGTFILPTEYEIKDALQAVAGLGGQVARTYTLDAGLHITAPRQYNEVAFKAMDIAVAYAGRYGTRLIVPLINDAKEPDMFGSYAKFAKLRGLNKEMFYVNQTLIDDFKHLIDYVLNRVNTVTGIAYKDDPAILAWQLGNELGSWEDPTLPPQWSIEIARFIKSIDPNHLVMDGTLVGYDMSRWALETLTCPYIDIFYNHYYWGISGKKIKEQAHYVRSHHKVFVISEYGLVDTKDIKKVIDTTMKQDSGVSGSLLWSLRFHTREGGFYSHKEWTGHMSYHVPGFAHREGFNQKDEREIVKYLQQSAFGIQGYKVPTIIPSPPELFARHGCLGWRGSAWAESYRILRSHGGQQWQVVADGLSDGVDYGQNSWSDSHASKGKYFYYIEAMAGRMSSGASNVVEMNYE